LEQKIKLLETEAKQAENAGLSEYSKELNNIITELKEQLETARKTKKEDKIKAREIIEKALVNTTKPGQSAEELKKEAKIQVEKIQNSLTLLTELGLESTQETQLKEIALEEAQKIEKIRGEHGLIGGMSSLEKINEIKEQISDSTNKKIEIAGNKIAENARTALEECEKAKTAMNELKQQIDAVKEEKLKANIPTTITPELVNATTQGLEAICSKHKKTLLNVANYAKDKEFEKIIKTTSEINTNEIKSQAAEKRIWAEQLLKEIRENAIKNLSDAKSKIEMLGPEEQEMINQAIDEARKNNYLKSLVLSRTALMGLSESTSINFEILIFPALLGLILAGYRLNKKKNRKIKVTYRKIPKQF